uniref:Uncharacterized protein n=1 Tax=Periophthalmus magnuspinnatus TaxID=409849 RepID=A0A3B3ZU10_9GOBI
HHSPPRDKDELQSPQADVRDGEDVVVAHVATPGLRFFVFISPNPLSRYDEHHHPEDEDHGQPYAPKDGGVLVDPADEGFQGRPVHYGSGLYRQKIRRTSRVSGVMMSL